MSEYSISEFKNLLEDLSGSNELNKNEILSYVLAHGEKCKDFVCISIEKYKDSYPKLEIGNFFIYFPINKDRFDIYIQSILIDERNSDYERLVSLIPSYEYIKDILWDSDKNINAFYYIVESKKNGFNNKDGSIGLTDIETAIKFMNVKIDISQIQSSGELYEKALKYNLFNIRQILQFID